MLVIFSVSVVQLLVNGLCERLILLAGEGVERIPSNCSRQE